MTEIIALIIENGRFAGAVRLPTNQGLGQKNPTPRLDLSDTANMSDNTLRRLYYNTQRIADRCHQMDEEIHLRAREGEYLAEAKKRGIEL